MPGFVMAYAEEARYGNTFRVKEQVTVVVVCDVL
jgi:hypothetical protein